MHTIVVGVDGSIGARHALEWAAARGRESGASIVAVHVLTYNRELFGDLPPTGLTNWRRELRRNLDGDWTEPARAAGSTVTTATVEDESSANGILAAAEDHGADLIVLGTHSHGKFADRLLGSTTYRVAHRARVPVVIIPTAWTPPASDPG